MNVAGVIGALLTAPAVVSAAYYGVAAYLLGRWLKKTEETGKAAVTLPAVTFFRPLKAGVPDLSAKLEALARAMTPEDQLLIGVELGSVEQGTAEALGRACPDRQIVVVPCPATEGNQNPKIAKLRAMEPFARHEHWILSDSEAVTDAAFLEAFRREWTQCDVLTAGYRFTNLATWPQRLDAAAVLLTLWPGLAILRQFGRVQLTLGACTGFRRADLATVGGWAAFANDLAEDNRLGRVLAAEGREIRLSNQVMTLECDPLSWRDYWRHQRRVAVTYRVASPWGFAGAFFSQGVTTSLLLACWFPAHLGSWVLFAGVLATRCLAASSTAKRLRFPIPFLAPVVLLASLVETLCWGLSWGTSRVWWGGKWRRISSTGRLLSAEPCRDGMDQPSRES